jgi:asparaginyl-tRNA synthetase
MAQAWDKIHDIFAGKTGDNIQIRGWIHRTRSSGKLIFLQVRDATGIIQVTIEKGNIPDTEFQAAKKALIESSVALKGKTIKDKRAPGGWEIHPESFTVINYADIFPITEQHSTEVLLDHRHLWLRSQQLTQIMKIKSSLLQIIREWFAQHNFFETTPSVITTNAAEGGATAFTFKYFDQKAFLSQTAQMYLEALIFSLERVWCLTPSFRAEKSRTRRHLIEYSHLEAEEAWLDNNQNIALQEDLVSYVCQKISATCASSLKALGSNPLNLQKITPPFPKITYKEAILRLQKKGFDATWGDDFGVLHEKALTEDEEKPLFITHFPQEIKAFYMELSPDGKTVECSDMLAPQGYGEIIGGSQRSEDISSMKIRLKKQGAKLENYEWFFDLRRFGSIPHSGFGMGIERLLCWITQQEHIRDMTPFPRLVRRAYP